MNAKFAGKCVRCRESFPAGTEINWSKETGATHAYPCTTTTSADPVVDYRKRQPDEKLVPGVYEVGEEIYVVKFNREKTRLYAKRLKVINPLRATEGGEQVGIDFEYAPGAIYDIKLADRMPLDRAKELVTLYGHCIACGRFLKAAKSVENGIGPVCIKNFGPVLNPVAETADGRTVRIEKPQYDFEGTLAEAERAQTNAHRHEYQEVA
jgi:hypothetical protein